MLFKTVGAWFRPSTDAQGVPTLRQAQGRPEQSRGASIVERRGETLPDPRGENGYSGLITPYRPMTMEAAAGKNPVSHVGRLYNLAASRMSATIAVNVPHVSSAECVLVSQIGRVASDPRIVDVCLAGDDRLSAGVASKAVTHIVRSELERFADLCEALLEERVQVY